MTQDTDPGFDRFWKLYPRHEAKKKAHQVWMKLAPDNGLVDTICEALAQQVAMKYAHTERRFIPLPTSWLNGQRWMDDVVEETSKLVPERKSRSQYGDAVMLSEYSERFKAQREWVKNNWTKPSDED